MLYEEATACVAVPQSLWLLCAYDPRDRFKKLAFLFLFVSCPPSHLLLRWSEFLLKPEKSEAVLRQELFGPLLGQFASQFGFLLRPRQPFLGGWGGVFSGFQLAQFGAPDTGAK